MSSGRVSSKQIGDELTNGWKSEKTADKKKKSKADAADIKAERSNPTSRALDATRMWPLMCFELSISVDQEERLLQALKRYVSLKRFCVSILPFFLYKTLFLTPSGFANLHHVQRVQTSADGESC